MASKKAWHCELLESGLPHLGSKKFTLTDLSYESNFYDENSLSKFFNTHKLHLSCIREATRAGHAPIFADAHRCASMRINRINSKKKIIFSRPKFCDFGLLIFIPEDG